MTQRQHDGCEHSLSSAWIPKKGRSAQVSCLTEAVICVTLL